MTILVELIGILRRLFTRGRVREFLHVLQAVLVAKEIPVGSPPHSSNTTNRFPVGFSHDRGM